MGKRFYKYVFIIVTFRNADDLYDFDKSAKNFLDNYKVIVVNSYFNDETKNRIKNIAEKLDYDFINSENKGYGFGNNIGIEYAKKKYIYDYIVISNSDVIITDFDESNMPMKNAIIGPQINTLNDKKQNPYWVYENKISQILFYYGYKNNSRIFMIFAQGFNKILRESFLLLKKSAHFPVKVYALHGSFVIISKDVIDSFDKIYDENMFLYYEEAYLSYVCKIKKIDKYFYPNIKILHKEDGSTKGIKINIDDFAKKSYLYYYLNVYKNKKFKC